MQLVTFVSSSFDTFKRRVIKAVKFAKNAATADQLSPFGIDSNPAAKGKLIAVYSETATKGQEVIIGYILRDQLAASGELRLYAMDSAGELVKGYIWLKNDGTYQFGGTSRHLTRFEEMKAAYDELRDDHNDLVNAFNTHMHATAGSGPPSTPTPGTGIPASASTASVDNAKIDNFTTA